MKWHKFPHLDLVYKKTLLPQDFGGYQAFPTVALVDSAIVVAFRRGLGKDSGEARDSTHGLGGEVYLTRSEDLGCSFSRPARVLAHTPGQSNEHDALLSRVEDGRLALITRSHGPELFINRIQFSADGGQTFSQPTELTTEGGYGAFFGHLIPDADGQTLLGSFYNADGSLVLACNPAGLSDPDAGPVALSVRGFVHRFKGETRLNETSLARLSSGKLLALLREQPVRQGLYAAVSDDDGHTFTLPEPIGVIGEAPSVLALSGNAILVLFRDLDVDRTAEEDFIDPDILRRERWQAALAAAEAAGLTEEEFENKWEEAEEALAEPPMACGVSLVFSPDSGKIWSEPFPLARYEGGRYHGGYGDMILLPDGSIFAVYHLAEKPGDLPHLCCCRFKLG
ncbi:MAG: sialidase family protein [Solidesulfovibrio sp.]